MRERDFAYPVKYSKLSYVLYPQHIHSEEVGHPNGLIFLYIPILYKVLLYSVILTILLTGAAVHKVLLTL